MELPFEQDVNAFVSQGYEHRTFFTRLHHFVLVSDAFVVVPGGIGTVLEAMMIWQLLQVQKLHNTPLILAGKMAADLVTWSRTYMLRPDFPCALGVTSPYLCASKTVLRSCGSSGNITLNGSRGRDKVLRRCEPLSEHGSTGHR